MQQRFQSPLAADCFELEYMSNYEVANTVKLVNEGKSPDPSSFFPTHMFPRPAFAFDEIHQLGSQTIRKTQEAIASGDLPKWSAPSFSEGLSIIMDHFGLRNTHHFFHAAPIRWASFHEPQITKGFEHFLREDNQAGDGQRIGAFLQTFGIKNFDKEPNFQVHAEAPTKNRERIDLQICWNGRGKTKEALIIEAKFGHTITSGQLGTYEQHALEIPEINKESLAFFVLSPGSKAQHSRLVAENMRWKEISWFKFLLLYQDLLPKGADSDEFRQFRRTVWRRASN